jgi:hypothetical protein
MTSKAVKCTCKSEFMDSKYGPQMRMANETRSGQYRCCACGALVGSAQIMSTTVSSKVAAKKTAPAPAVITKKDEKKSGMKKGNKR